MSDTPTEIPTARAPRAPSPWRALLWLAALALVAAAGWQAWLHFAGETARREEMVARLAQEVETLRRQNAEQERRVETLAGSVTQLDRAVSGGRQRVQLAAVEQLLLLANDRLLLARDVAGAQTALATADARLAALKDPELLPVREALAAERAALAALPAADVAGAALALAQVMRDAPRFALRARVPDRFEPQAPDPAPSPSDGGDRLWGAVKTALAAIFTLRRTEGPALRLLAPEEEVLAARILQLRLEGARIALLAGDGATLRDLARASADWLRAYYNDGDTAVRAALATLERVAGLELDPPAPDIGRSLKLLRQQLAAP